MICARFNIRLAGAYLPAPVAQEVADLDGARAMARTIVQRLMRQHGGDPRLLDAALVITGADGATLLELSFFDALYLPVEPVADPDRRRPAPPRRIAPERWRAALIPVRRLTGALSARRPPRPGP
jgi:hypothetical protein